MKFEVIIEPAAEIEPDEAYQYIREDSAERAARWRLSLLNAVESLEHYPRRCPVATESSASRDEIRHLIHGNYRIIFTIRSTKVFVVHIRHAARGPLEDGVN